jgi:type I restriction enzyme S subunit
VIQHLEPHHLGHLSVPTIDETKAAEIERLISLYHEELTEGSHLIRSAITDIETWCGTSGQVHPKQGLQHASVRAADINFRLDASYHGPDVVASEQSMMSSVRDYRPLSDPTFTTSVVLPSRFRRTYVRATFGRPLVGGKYIGTLDPRNDKHIILDGLTEANRAAIPASVGQILVTRSGTVGKLMLVPAHWEGWALSDHIIRINAVDKTMAAYIYAWLSSETGRMQVQRQIYGSVVDELDVDQLSSVLVPVPTSEELENISNRVNGGVERWSRASAAESEALTIMEQELHKRWLPPTS